MPAIPVDGVSELVLEVVSFDDDDRGRSLYVHDPDDNVVECWTWDVGGHLASS